MCHYFQKSTFLSFCAEVASDIEIEVFLCDIEKLVYIIKIRNFYLISLKKL